MLDKIEKHKIIVNYSKAMAQAVMSIAKVNALEETLDDLGVKYTKLSILQMVGGKPDDDVIKEAIKKTTVANMYGVYKKYGATKKDIEEIFGITGEAITNGIKHKDMINEMKEKIGLDFDEECDT